MRNYWQHRLVSPQGYHPLCCELVLKIHFSASPKIKLLRVERSPPPCIALYLAPHSLRSVEDSPYFFSPVYWTISDNLLTLSLDESRWFYHNFKVHFLAQLVSTRPSASWQIQTSIPRYSLKFMLRRLVKTEHRWRGERLLSAMSASVCKSDDNCFGLKSEGAYTLSTVMLLHSNICLLCDRYKGKWPNTVF